MHLIVVYISSDGDACNGDDDYPYNVSLCNDIDLGLQDARAQYMKAGDWVGQLGGGWLWLDLSKDSDFAKTNDLDAGTLYFVDNDNNHVLFELGRLYVSRSRVREVAKLCLEMKYEERNGVEGYIAEDPNEDSGYVWLPLPALADERFRSAFGNPFISFLEILGNILSEAIDKLIPGLLNLIPWPLYAIGAGYLALRTKESYSDRRKGDPVKVNTYLYGAGAAFLGYRGYKSFESKQES